jgi:hypothetical protein
MDTNLNGYMEQMVTFKADDTLTKTGVPVMFSDNNTVCECVAGSIPSGICIALRNGYATVQTAGYVKVNTSTKVPLGYKSIAANGKGGVEISETGRYCIIANRTDTEAGIIL